MGLKVCSYYQTIFNSLHAVYLADNGSCVVLFVVRINVTYQIDDALVSADLDTEATGDSVINEFGFDLGGNQTAIKEFTCALSIGSRAAPGKAGCEYKANDNTAKLNLFH